MKQPSSYDPPSMVWLATSGALVWIMIPGVGLLYSGLSRKKHALSLLWASLMATCVVTFQWFFWGYSLAFGTAHGGGFIGDLHYFALMHILDDAEGTVLPSVVFCFFQCMFAMITGAIMLGGACERARLGPMLVFLFIWTTVVYCPCACWTWNADGWLAKLGAYDFAGGGPVHQSSGWGALAYALMCGKRHDPVTQKGLPKYKPHSVTSIVLGTVFLWFGWFGFNGGSSNNASLRGYYACLNTNLAAACGGITWLLVDWFRCGHKWTTVGLCSGSIAGLVGITPAAGFVPIYFAVPIGIITAFVCNYALDIKELIQIDDGVDCWGLHGVGGFVGSVLTGLFSAGWVVAIDPALDANAGGWLDHHWVQLGYQLAANTSVCVYSFTVTSIILFIMDKIPFLKIRLSEEEEQEGTDSAQIGEFTYTPTNMYIPEPVRSVTSKGGKANVKVDLEASKKVPMDDTPESSYSADKGDSKAAPVIASPVADVA